MEQPPAALAAGTAPASLTCCARAAAPAIATYQNFAHRKKYVYRPYSNVRPLEDFRHDLSRLFAIERACPRPTTGTTATRSARG